MLDAVACTTVIISSYHIRENVFIYLYYKYLAFLIRQIAVVSCATQNAWVPTLGTQKNRKYIKLKIY